MARIPQVVAKETIDTASRTIPRLETDYAMSRAMTGAGSAIGGIGTVVDQIMERERRQREATEDFVADQRFQQFASNMGQRLDEHRQKAQPGALDLTANYVKDLDDQARKWLEEKNVPDRLRERYEARLGTLRTTLTNKAADVEYSERNKFFTESITAGAGKLGADVANNPDNLIVARENLFASIDRSTLPAAEKASLKSRHGMTLAKAGIDGLIRQERYDEARELATSVSGIGRLGATDGPVVLDDQKRAVRDTITKVSSEIGVQPEVVLAIAQLESGLNPGAKNKKTGADGLFQIMPDEAKAKGVAGADIETQVRYGIERLRRDGADLERRGIPVTPATLYLAHFQGVGGAEKILNADPAAPLKDTLDSARPNWGGKNGETWGEAVIAANNIKADSTNQQFLSGIARKVNGALIAASTTELGWTERAALVDQTETWIKSDQNRRQTEQREAIRTTKALVDNDIASIQATGVEIGELSEKRVADHLGAEGARQWVIARERARRQYEMTKDFDTAPAADIETRLAALATDAEQAAGTGAYNAAVEVYDAARKKADRILKMREDDPARAVETDSSVKAALGMLNNGQPQTVQNLVAARYAAQEKAGIPPNARSPITNREGREIAATLENALPNERSTVLRRTVMEIQVRYGEYADDVLRAVAGQFVKDQAVKQLAGGIIKKLGMGEPVTPAEMNRMDRTGDAEAAEAAMAGRQPGGLARDGAPFTAGAKPAPEDPATLSEIEKHRRSFTPSKPIDVATIQRLIANPEIAGAVDAEFGKGAAQWILKGRDLLTQRGDRRPAGGADGKNPS